jgi:hypothetical protein
MALEPSRVNGPMWKRGDEVTLLYNVIDRNDFSIWNPLPSQVAEVKHIKVVVICPCGLEPMDIGKRMMISSKV